MSFTGESVNNLPGYNPASRLSPATFHHSSLHIHSYMMKSSRGLSLQICLWRFGRWNGYASLRAWLLELGLGKQGPPPSQEGYEGITYSPGTGDKVKRNREVENKRIAAWIYLYPEGHLAKPSKEDIPIENPGNITEWWITNRGSGDFQAQKDQTSSSNYSHRGPRGPEPKGGPTPNPPDTFSSSSPSSHRPLLQLTIKGPKASHIRKKLSREVRK
jgi:hypothetical protein